MNWHDTTSSQCRYGDIAGNIWGDWNILWEDAEADYQGHASFLAEKGGKYSFYEWWYGSCSGCDGWEADGASDEAIEAEMRSTAIWLDSKEELKRWAEMLDKPGGLSNYDMERGGGLAAGIDILGGGLASRIEAIRSHLREVAG
ncbi:MAG TPA: hypothetical protein VLK35_02150 [Methylomirabilota bacterium]|nr:hypothetical protein [Methylomirabilota bacterium]